MDCSSAMASLSTGCQKCLSYWGFAGRNLCGATSRFCCLRGVFWIGMSSLQIFIWPQAVFQGLVRKI